MPIYEYYCPACHGYYSALQKIGEAPPPCPRCESEDVRKLISAAGVVHSEQEHTEAFMARRSQASGGDRQEVAQFFRESSKELASRYEGEIAGSDVFAELLDGIERGATDADLSNLETPLADAANSPYKMLGPESDPAAQEFIKFTEAHEHRARKFNVKTADYLGWAKR